MLSNMEYPFRISDGNLRRRNRFLGDCYIIRNISCINRFCNIWLNPFDGDTDGNGVGVGVGVCKKEYPTSYQNSKYQ